MEFTDEDGETHVIVTVSAACGVDGGVFDGDVGDGVVELVTVVDLGLDVGGDGDIGGVGDFHVDKVTDTL